MIKRQVIAIVNILIMILYFIKFGNNLISIIFGLILFGLVFPTTMVIFGGDE